MLINKDFILACSQTFEVVLFFSLFFSCLFKTGDFSSLCSDLIAFSRAHLHPVLLKLVHPKVYQNP